MQWNSPPTYLVGEQVAVFLSVTTAESIDAFSLAYRINNKAVSLQSVDFQATIFPAGLSATFEASALFETRLVASPHPDFDLLVVSSLFADATFPHNHILFPATTGAVTNQRLLRIVLDVRPDAPTDVVTCVMTPTLPNNYTVFGAGLVNEFAHTGMSRLPGTTDAVKTTILLDPDEAVVFSRGDSNNDGVIDISDPPHTLGYLFPGSVASIPSPVFPDCDVDPPDEDELSCLFYTSCPE
jgi:hypothetical protein